MKGFSSFFTSVLSILLASMVLISGLIASGSIVFEPQADGMDICKKRNILVIEGFMPQDKVPEDPSKEANCSSSVSAFWTVQESPSFHFTTAIPFSWMIPEEPDLLDRDALVETPPPCA